MIKVLVEVTRDQQIEIEDICHSKGLSISQYLMGLHEDNKMSKTPQCANEKSNPATETENGKNERNKKKGRPSKKPEQFEMDMKNGK